MANLSNINGKFVVEQTTGYVGVGTTDPNYPIEVLNASAEIALNASGASIYRLRSDNTDSFRINKNGVGDRLVIAGNGNATFSGSVTVPSVLANSFMEIRSDTASLYFENAANNNYYRLKRSSNDFVIDYYNGTTTSDRLTIDSSGNVGIEGTPSTFANYTNVTIKGGSSGSNLDFKNSSGTRVAAIVSNPSSDFGIETNEATPILFKTNGSERMRITSGGNVAIGGTLGTDSQFRVELKPAATILAGLRIGYNSTSNNYFDGDNQYFRNGLGSAIRMLIDSSGNSSFYGTIKSFSTGAAHLILNGDTNNSGDTGEVDAIIDLLGDGNPGIYGYRINTENWSGQTALNFQEYLNGSYTSRLFISKDGNVGVGVNTPVTKLEVDSSTGNSSIKTGAIEMQSYAVNNAWIADNIYYDGAFRLRSAGYGSQVYFGSGGTITFNRYPTGNAGDAVTSVPSMVLASDGNVGINTTSPGQKLHLNETGSTSVFAQWSNNSLSKNSYLGLTNAGMFAMQTNDNIAFYTGASYTERMRITSTGAISVGSSGTAYGAAGEVLTSNGNAPPSWQAAGGGGAWTTTGNDIYNSNSGSVGINNTSPSSHYSDYNQLVVGSGNGNQGMTIFAGSNDESSINFTDTTTTFSNNFVIKVDHNDPSESNNPSFQINYETNRYVTINKQTTGSNQVPQVRLGMFNSSSLPANLDHSMLEIGINNGLNNPGMVMYGDSQGNSNPFVGMVSTSSSSSITTKFFRFYHNTTLCGTIQKRFNANEVQYLTTSDYRLKEDLKPFKALDTICKIKVYNYKWNNIEVDNVNYGVLAHELQELIPEVVAGEKDEVNKNGEEEYQSVDYSKLVPHLIQSIQELKADNDSLKARIETLENK